MARWVVFLMMVAASINIAIVGVGGALWFNWFAAALTTFITLAMIKDQE